MGSTFSRLFCHNNDPAFFLDLNAELNGTIDVEGGVTGTLDTGKIQLFQVGIPGLEFPG